MFKLNTENYNQNKKDMPKHALDIYDILENLNKLEEDYNIKLTKSITYTSQNGSLYDHGIYFSSIREGFEDLKKYKVIEGYEEIEEHNPQHTITFNVY